MDPMIKNILWHKSVGTYAHILILFTLAIGQINIFGQDCGFDIAHQHELSSQSNYSARTQDFDLHWKQAFFARSSDTVTHVLPVVFHIVHNNDAANITDARVLKSLDNLNQAFANSGFFNPETGVDTRIQFCLAKKSPSNTFTTGITRDVSPLSTMTIETDDETLKSLSAWDPTCYINVWIVSEISSLSGGDAVSGYAYFPTVHGTAIDGIVVEADFIGTADANTSLLVHEMGHYLGLYHTFEGGCFNDDCLLDGDRVCDTPPDQSTATVGCDFEMNSCETDAQSGFASDMNDMINNYMDYGDLNCANAFTEDQKCRMRFSIDNARASLLDCASCQDPCPSPISIEILSPASDGPVGEPVNLEANVLGSQEEVTWYLDGVMIELGNQTVYTFESVGKQFLVAEITDENCGRVSDTVCLDIFCPLEADIIANGPICIPLNTDLVIDLQASGDYTEISWQVGDDIVLNQNSVTVNFNTAEVINVYVTLRNGLCEVLSNTITLYGGCQEICDNQIDDDGDGLIDCFDDDCCSLEFCQGQYTECVEECSSDFGRDAQVLNRIFSDRKLISNVNPLVGDIDQDGVTEILIGERHEGFDISILILNGQDLSIENTIDLTSRGYGGQFTFTIGDVDKNDGGKAEIIIFAFEFNKIICLNHDGTVVWETTDISQLDGFRNVSLVDFNGDGLPEVLTEFEIINGQTGQRISSLIDNPNYSSTVVAIDAVPSDICATCEGAELVVGNRVYTVDMNTTNGTADIDLFLEISQYDEGEFVSRCGIVDWDDDGDLDVLTFYKVQAIPPDIEFIVYVYDLQTSEIIDQAQLTRPNMDITILNLGLPVVANIDADPELEVVFAQNNELLALDHDFSILWTYEFNNNFAIDLSTSAFDFDNDGAVEILMRSIFDMLVFDGASGTVLYKNECASATTYDYPVVADINDDGLTEMICVCGADPAIPDVALPSDEAYYGMKVYGAANRPWIGSRPVYNQQNYFNTHINDDLSIPLQIQSHAKAFQQLDLNNYRVQAKLPNALTDATLRFTGSCGAEEGVFVDVEICNVGTRILSGQVPISFHNENPTQTTSNVIFQVTEIGQNIEVDSCQYFQYFIETDASSIYGVVNDFGTASTPYSFTSDFPMGLIAECIYYNNLDSISVEYYDDILDLGPDIDACAFGVTVLDAGAPFAEYRWQDGSTNQTFTAFTPGMYWVEVTDSCGLTQADSINITISPGTILDLGPDIVTCAGETIVIPVSSHDEYYINFDQSAPCINCDEITIVPTESAVFYVTGISTNGCSSTDSIFISIGDSYLRQDTVSLCGVSDSVFFVDRWIKESGVYRDTVVTNASCDSIFILHVIDAQPADITAISPIMSVPGEEVQLTLMGDLDQIESISWSPTMDLSCIDCISPFVSVTKSTEYQAAIELKNGCTFTVEYAIEVNSNDVFIPNAFSPNDDGVNDRFLIYNTQAIASIDEVKIYNRWGGVVYAATDLSSDWNGWDGTSGGKKAMVGTYVYKIRFMDADQNSQMRTGTILLIE